MVTMRPPAPSVLSVLGRGGCAASDGNELGGETCAFVCRERVYKLASRAGRPLPDGTNRLVWEAAAHMVLGIAASNNVDGLGFIL